MKTFAQTVSDNNNLKSLLMQEFEVAESTIDRWAHGIVNPHPLLKQAVIRFLDEQKMKSEVPEDLQNTRQKMVEAILVEFDPIGLIKLGAPKDEYFGEASEIIRHFPSVSNIEELSQVIWAVFVTRFDLKQTGEMGYYKLIAGEVWNIRNIRKQEVAVNKVVTTLKDKAMSLVGDRALSLAKDVSEGSIVALNEAKTKARTWFSKRKV